jgi:hypothetical protein
LHELSKVIDLIIRVYTNINGRKREVELPLTFSDLGAKPDSWLAEAFLSLAHQSYQQQPIIRSQLDNITRALRYARGSIEIVDILDLPRHKLKTENIYQLYLCFERTLDAIQFPNKSTPPTLSGAFRSFVKLHLPKCKAAPIAIEGIKYRSMLPLVRSPRPTLNFKKTTGKSESTLLGAIEFESHSELIQNSLKILREDLNLIINACKADMDYFSNIREKIHSSINMRTPEALNTFIESLILKGSINLQEEALLESTSKELILSAYLKAIRRVKLERATSPPWKTYKSRELLNSVQAAILPGQTSRHVFNSIYRLSNIELEVLMLLLLCRTGWNRDSLLSLTTEGITRRDDGSYHIQGFKNKTSDYTPPVIINKSEKYEISAIRLLLWNRARLVRLGFIKRNNTGLWNGWTKPRGELLAFPSNLYNAPSEFCARHSIPKFIAEQIRTQVLNINNYERRNIEDTRRIAGHSSISATAHYLDQVINYDINSSINLDFQKKLEAKIKFNLKKRLSAHSALSTTLIPIGDGSMCKDPAAPPDRELNTERLCPALSCHKGDGCVNRVILIDFDRAEEIIRTKRYYRDNWKRLYSENQANFEINIASKMLFNCVIYDYIKSSAHAHTFNKIERGIFDEE